MRKTAIFCILLYICTVFQRASAVPPLRFPSAEGASVGLCVVRLSDMTVVAEHDATRLLVPASVLKCLTAATAQLLLPADYAFITRLGANGRLTADGTLDGDLSLTGGWDPTLGSRFFTARKPFVDWAIERLKEWGVKRVAGGVVVGNAVSAADALSPYWLLEDLEWEYGAGCYPLNYGDNSYDSREGRLADTDPGATLCNLLAAMMKGADIAVEGGEDDRVSESIGDVAGAESLFAAYSSPCRDEILRVMMHRSDNLYAEAMLRAPLLAGACGSVDGIDVRCDSALIRQVALWDSVGIDLRRGRIVDGSGLAPVNRLSARMLADILCHMGNKKEYVGLFPLVGREGTVRNFLRRTPLDGRMALKSGSMTGVLCYAGYLLGSDGSATHAVVIMVNGFTCPSSKVKDSIAAYLRGMF